MQYADYAVWQREWLQGEVLERQLAYWKEHLAGAPALLELPTDRPRPAVQTFRGAHQRLGVPAELTQRLKALGQREGATLFMTLLAAFQTLLSRYRVRIRSWWALRSPTGRVRRWRADRFLREHPGVARRPVGRSELCGVAGSGA